MPKKSETGNFITKKAGPLPVWGWGVVAIGGFFLYRQFASGSAGGGGTTASNPAGTSYPPGTEIIIPGPGQGNVTAGTPQVQQTPPAAAAAVVPPSAAVAAPTAPGGAESQPAQTPPVFTGFYALSPAAAANLLGSNEVGYQSGQEAINWDVAHGVSPAGIDPSSYYPLSAPAARALVASGNPLYQSAAEAQAWATAHPGG